LIRFVPGETPLDNRRAPRRMQAPPPPNKDIAAIKVIEVDTND